MADVNQNATFREAKNVSVKEQPVPEAKNPDRVHQADETPAPIALYRELKGLPYSADYFDVVKIWDRSDTGLKDDLEVIDDYYKQKVQSGEYEDGEESYKSMIKEAEKATNTKNAGTNLKIAKIAEFFRFMKRIEDIERNSRRWQ